MRHTDRHAAAHACEDFDVCLEDVLRYALAIGTVLVLVLPAARGFSETLGWLPLWLLAMPGVALWALRGFPLPRRAETSGVATATHRRRVVPQARRRTRSLPRRGLSRAA
jgi:hypothetical protein